MRLPSSLLTVVLGLLILSGQAMADYWRLPDGRIMETSGKSTPPVAGAKRLQPQALRASAPQVQQGWGQQQAQPGWAQVTQQPLQQDPRARADNSAVSQRGPRLTEADKAQLRSIGDMSLSLLAKGVTAMDMTIKLRGTSDAVQRILGPSPTTAPGDPLNKLAAYLDLWNIWRPESAVNAFSPTFDQQYSALLKSIASQLNTISANIDQRNMRGGLMANGVDELKIFIATLLDKRATSAPSVPDSLVTQYVVDWYVENYAQLASRIGNGPLIQKKSWTGANNVNRNELKVWCFTNKRAIAHYRYGNAVVPDNLSYFNNIPSTGRR